MSWDSGARGSLLASSAWSNPVIISIFAAASARRHVLMSSPYKKVFIYTPIPGVSSPVENLSCPESARCCAGCVIIFVLDTYLHQQEKVWCFTLFTLIYNFKVISHGFAKMVKNPVNLQSQGQVSHVDVLENNSPFSSDAYICVRILLFLS